MAKGHEDTAYYRHTRLLALDEVGGDPDGPLRGDAIERFHVHQQQRLASGRPGRAGRRSSAGESSTPERR